jgi:hypothetical protein
MMNLSHRVLILSMAATVAGPSFGAAAQSNVYVGRWTVSDDKPAFSSKGQLYRTIDIAPCGRNYCGVSVGRNGTCGPVLFRFLARTIARDEGLVGHGRWGSQTKNIEISAARTADAPGGRYMELNLGDGHDFGERSGNMPKFSAGYGPAGPAKCRAR